MSNIVNLDDYREKKNNVISILDKLQPISYDTCSPEMKKFLDADRETLNVMENMVDNLVEYGIIPELYEEEILEIEVIVMGMLKE